MEPASQSVDKAVSTEDLGLVTRDIHLEVARLEAMLNTLVENKVESMKAEKTRGSTGGGDTSRPSGSATATGSGPATASDKHTQRITSTSTASSSQRVAGSGRCPKRKRRNPHWDSEHGYNKSSSHASRIEMSPRRSYNRRAVATTTASMELPCCEHGVHLQEFTDDEDIYEDDVNEAFDFLTYGDHRAYVAVCDIDGTACSCADNHNGQLLKVPYDDDYVSINIDDFENVEEDAIIAHDALRRARRKRRKRRKKRKKRLHRERERQRLAATTVATIDKVKVIDPDDLPQRARWTIVITACLLLLMCLLLVGVTLRMAPIIDDMEAMYSPSPTPTPTLTPYPSATPSPYPSRHTSGSPSPSPSSSFLGDRALLLSRKHTIPFVLVSGRPCCGHRLQNRSSSLDDVRSLRNFSTGCDGRHRRSASAKSSRRRKESVYSDGRRASRRPSTSIDRSRSGSARSRRISAVSTSTPITPYVQTTFDGNMIDEEYLKKHRRHRIAFWMFLGSFIFIAMSSILVVVITLTHQSEYNTTVTYYTFAKPSSMVIDGQQTRSQGE